MFQNGYIKVKLPDDVQQHLGKNFARRKDDQISSILGNYFLLINID
jgi:hypothetical protein